LAFEPDAAAASQSEGRVISAKSVPDAAVAVSAGIEPE
jgi:hypothetical protein